MALDKDKKFSPPPLSSIPGKASDSGLTIAAMPYDTETLTSTAFGKLNPNQHGVLPVLVVFQNESKKAIRLERMKVEYIDRDRTRIEATPPSEVPYLKGPRRPNFNPSPIPGISLNKKKNPLAAQEIEGRAFAAKMMPPGDSAHGFFYFQTSHQRGGKLYITGLDEAGTGKELLYFEIPLE